MTQRSRPLFVVLAVLLAGCAGAKPPTPVLDREAPGADRLALIHSEHYVVTSMPAQGDALHEAAALQLDSLLTHFLMARARHFGVTVDDRAESAAAPATRKASMPLCVLCCWRCTAGTT